MKIIDNLALQRAVGFEPHQGEKEVLQKKAKRKVISAGVRWGKSKTCAFEGFRYLMASNQKIWVVSLTYDMAKKIFDYVIDFAGTFDRRLLKGVQKRPTPRIEIPEWGSVLECKSAENETSLMGEELDLAILDEAARMKPEVWQRYILARLSSRQGSSFIISTPFGKNWFYHAFLDAKQTGDAFHFQSKDSPYFPNEAWENAREKLPERIFKQEYQALFLDDAASVFRKVREVVGDTLEDVKSGHYYTLGVDLGKHHDFTVLTVIDKYTNKVVYFDRFKEIDWPLQKQRISSVAKRYNSARIVIDSTGMGDPIYDDLRTQSLLVDDFKFTNQSKEHLVNKLSIFIEQKKVFLPDNETLIDELESFGYKLTGAGNVQYSAPTGMHDDCVFSLALAVWGLTGMAKPLTAIQKELKKVKRAKVRECI